MQTIYKYTLTHGIDNEIEMHQGTIVRRVAMQGSSLCIWAELDNTARKSKRTFRIIGTGHLIPENGHYLGSCDDGPFVWHVLELIA